jgi:hypothetical protein
MPLWAANGLCVLAHHEAGWRCTRARGSENSAVFGGLMIVTGTTAIAPSSRTEQLLRRPAAWLQWKAIIDDPFGALVAVLAFSVILVIDTEGAAPAGPALALIIGVALVAVVGLFGWRLQERGIADVALVGSLAFVLVAVTVVVRDFTLAPFVLFSASSGAARPV